MDHATEHHIKVILGIGLAFGLFGGGYFWGEQHGGRETNVTIQLPEGGIPDKALENFPDNTYPVSHFKSNSHFKSLTGKELSQEDEVFVYAVGSITGISAENLLVEVKDDYLYVMLPPVQSWKLEEGDIVRLRAKVIGIGPYVACEAVFIAKVE